MTTPPRHDAPFPDGHGSPPSGARLIDGRAIGLDARTYDRIDDPDDMPPFLMTVVGASDLWMFVSSNGGITAGRRDPDHALFPYTTEDKVADGARHTGGLTLLRVRPRGGNPTIWRPFDDTRPGDPVPTRTIYKDVLGTALVFEETREELGLCVRVVWQTSRRYGVVRTCQLTCRADRPVDVEILDGLRNLVASGSSRQVQNDLSVLLDAYTRGELNPGTGLGLHYLNSGLTDLAEPSESLHATVAWQVGLRPAGHLLSVRQLDAFATGQSLVTEEETRGERGAYVVHAGMRLDPGQQRSWRLVADVSRSAADVVALDEELADAPALAARLDADIEATRAGLEALVATVDADQLTGEPLATGHHRANVVFNSMRGGVPAHGSTVEAADVRSFVRDRSARTADRCAAALEALPARLTHAALVDAADRTGDPDLWRLTMEYLPLTFSRRHGDPSRPWNTFTIALTDPDGNPRLDYQGNWRDIFQNWEALAWSYPELVESMITVFVDATTADGYNPYRISRDGIDWEVPEPDNPWSNIGYWGDHQIVYLLRLLETAERFHPGRLRDLVHRAAFTHADVPYRIASYARTVEDPSATITFDEDAAAVIAGRVEAEGADGRLVHGPDGDLVRVTLAEKLLILLLAKVVNLVPDGGIWMNTQRPEWNDANNALVGRGLSVVTLAHLRRYVAFLRGLLDDDVTVSAPVERLMTTIGEVLDRHVEDAERGVDDRTRRLVMDGLGAAGTTYRSEMDAATAGSRVQVPADRVHDLLDTVQRYVDSGLRANLRDDGLAHAYNTVELTDGRAAVRRLQTMLEGQVAMLSSGVLTPRRCVDLLRALRASDLHEPRQHSYMLYPNRDLPGFLDRNRVTPEQASRCPLLPALVEAGDRSLILRDVRGTYRFAPGIRNARDVRAALDAVSGRTVPRSLVEQERAVVLEIFEDVFDHAQFTGRSGTFFAYEGLGSIYWHMVAKLLLAVQETLEHAIAEGAEPTVTAELADVYEDVRSGLGYCKTAAVYGAFPMDPYSHTPWGRGARQPGMTGQVKEEILTRMGELGLRVEDGRIVVRPFLLRDTEWLPAPATFSYRDVAGDVRSLDLPAGGLAFTFCQVPVIYRRGDHLAVTVEMADGSEVESADGHVDREVSSEVFSRTGRVRAIAVTVPARTLEDDDGDA